jgi:hypothetical protein
MHIDRGIDLFHCHTHIETREADRRHRCVASQSNRIDRSALFNDDRRVDVHYAFILIFTSEYHEEVALILDLLSSATFITSKLINNQPCAILEQRKVSSVFLNSFSNIATFVFAGTEFGIPISPVVDLPMGIQ